MKKAVSILAVVAALFLMVGQASALQYSFDNISNNNALDAAAGEAQLFMDVVAVGTTQVSFKFSNIGPAASSITDIYFDDDIPLLTYNGFTQSSGVDFSVGANPSNLPGGNAPTFHFSSNYGFDSDAPTQPNGVNPGEWLTILFNLTSQNQYSSILAALENESFRVGIHVQGFACGGSEAFINTPPDTPPVPEPGTIVLLGAGLLGLAAYSRKRIQK